MFVNIRDSSLSPISYVSDMNLRVIHNVIISDEGTVKYVSDNNLRVIHNEMPRVESCLHYMELIVIS